MKEIVLSDSDISRFWSKVDIRGENECWEWRAGRDADGYGVFSVSHRVSHKAHRISLTLKLGRQMQEGMFACHTCDNPSCVNPSHLREWTHYENAQDEKSKGRYPVGDKHGRRKHPERWIGIERDYQKSASRGEKNGSSKLTEKDVATIRELRNRGTVLRVISERFGVSMTTISHIARGKGWKHIG